MTATRRRLAVEHLKGRRFSERRAYRLVGFSRSADWYLLKGRDDSRLRERLNARAERYPRYGYPTLHDMLRAEGCVLNRKRNDRIYGEQGLQVRTQRRGKFTRPRVPKLAPDSVNPRWSINFKPDQLANGRRFRILDVVEEYSRECVLQIVGLSISGKRPAAAGAALAPVSQPPDLLRAPAPAGPGLRAWAPAAPTPPMSRGTADRLQASATVSPRAAGLRNAGSLRCRSIPTPWAYRCAPGR